MSGLAGVAGAAIVAGQVVAWSSASPSVRDVMPAAGALLIAPAIPLLGAVLVARRRPEGVAVLVAAALIGLPAIMLSASLLASSRPPGGQATSSIPYLAAQLSIVAAGAAAWGLREPDRWRWNRPVAAPLIVLGAVALLPALLMTMHGVLFSIAVLAGLNMLELASLAELVVAVGLLAWATRLPRKTAAAVMLVLLVPRSSEWLAMLWRGPGLGGFTTDPLSWLGLVAEAALIAAACWWLTREDEVPTYNAVVEPRAHVTR